MTAVLPDELTRDNTKDIAKNDEFFENVLGKIKARQWTLADFDWDKPGLTPSTPSSSTISSSSCRTWCGLSTLADG